MNTTSSGMPLRVAVLSGGESAEREVSLRSGAAVAAALVAAGHQAVLIDPSQCALADVDWPAFDAAFVALHGGAGEDGRIQRQLDALGVSYTGSGPEACRLAMSKSTSKERFAECHVPTPRCVLLDAGDSRQRIEARVASLGYPLVIKPDSQGSSLGVTVVDTPQDLPAAVATAATFDQALLAEVMVRGREFTVAVWGDRPLPLLEIVTAHRVFSYDAKYHSSLAECSFDFALSTEKRAELLHVAVEAARAIGTRGLARVDLMLGQDGCVWVLEVNTSPGMTSCSLAPRAAARAGLDMTELVEQLVRECLTPELAA